MDISLPPSSGFTSYWDNVGEIINKGIEFSLVSHNIEKPNFNWSTNFNIAHNYNEIVSIGPYSEDAVAGGTNDTRVVVGMPVGTNFLVRFCDDSASFSHTTQSRIKTLKNKIHINSNF